jgi:hypothetical protein
VLGRGRTRRTAHGVRKKSSASGRRLCFNGKRWGGGPRGVDTAWRKRARAGARRAAGEGERGGALTGGTDLSVGVDSG